MDMDMKNIFIFIKFFIVDMKIWFIFLKFFYDWYEKSIN